MSFLCSEASSIQQCSACLTWCSFCSPPLCCGESLPLKGTRSILTHPQIRPAEPALGRRPQFLTLHQLAQRGRRMDDLNTHHARSLVHLNILFGPNLVIHGVFPTFR